MTLGFGALGFVASLVPQKSATGAAGAPVDPTTVSVEPEFTRDVRAIGHHGTGDLEVRISNDADLEKAKPLILRSYEES